MTYPKQAFYVAISAGAMTLLSFGGARAASASPASAASSAGGAVAPAAPAATAAPKTHGYAPADMEVLKALHASNLVAMKVGKAARDRAILDAVKSFAGKVMSDHAREDKKIAVFLKKRGLRVSALGTASTDGAAEHAAYKSKTGSAFDHAFAAQMALDYRKSIDLVEKARKDTADDTIRALLDELLPTLQVLEVSAKVLSDGKEPG